MHLTAGQVLDYNQRTMGYCLSRYFLYICMFCDLKIHLFFTLGYGYGNTAPGNFISNVSSV